MSTQRPKIVKCKLCDKRLVSKDGLIDHIDKLHNSSIPEGWSAARYENYLRTGKTEGRCVYCHVQTGWNPATGKYNRMCGSEACKKKAREIANKNYIGLHGKPYSIDDPEQQKKMVYGRKNSGTYIFEDEKTGKQYKAMYDSSYGKAFFEMIDTLLNWDGADIIAPSPHTYYYEYEGKKHFYIPDAYSTSLNLEIELKDGGDNPNNHPKIQAVDKVKEELKDKVMVSIKDQVNYIKICNKDYTEFFAMLSRLKAQDECPLPKWESRYEAKFEAFLNANMNLGDCFKGYYLSAKKINGGPDEELYSNTLDMAIRQVLSSISLHVKKGHADYYVYTRGKEYATVYLGTVTIWWYDFWDHVDPQYDFEWEEQEEVDLDLVHPDYIKQEVVAEACKDVETARKFVREVGELAKKYDANYFLVTDGASGISNKGNPAVRNAREAQIKWEKRHGFDPDEDWSGIQEGTDPIKMVTKRINLAKRATLMSDPTINYDTLLLYYRTKLFHTRLDKREWMSLYSELESFRDQLKIVINGNSENDKRMKYEAKNALTEVDGFLQYMDEAEPYQKFNPVHENFIIPRKNLEINLDKWEVGTPLWITGTSGDGKSTLAMKMEKENNAILIHTDLLLLRVVKSKEKFEQRFALAGQSKDHPLNHYGIEYINEHPELPYDLGLTKSGNSETYMLDFLKWIITACKTIAPYNERLVIVEGCDICLLGADFLSKQPLIILGCSRVQAGWRRIKREVADGASYIDAAIKVISRYNNVVKRLDDNKEKLWVEIQSRIPVTEGVVSHINPKYVGKETFNLSDYTRVPINANTLSKYKGENPMLKHIREDDHGVLWLDGHNVVGVVGVAPHKETVNHEQMWIHGFEISKDYRGHGLAKQMLDVAVRELGAEYLSVAKKNEVAIELYKKVGFVSYGENRDMYFMKLGGSETPEFVEESTVILDVPVVENTIFSRDDIRYNFDKWKPGKDTNVLLVTGVSGSGKTTLAYEIASDYKAEVFQLDWVDCPQYMQDSPETPNYGLWQYVQQMCGRPINHMKVAKDFETRKQVFDQVFSAILAFAHSHSDKLFIVEGIQIPGVLRDYPGIEKFPIIIKGTSIIHSMIQRLKRDGVHMFTGVNGNIIQWYFDIAHRISSFEDRVIHVPMESFTELYGSVNTVLEAHAGSGVVSYGYSPKDVQEIVDSLTEKEQEHIGHPKGDKFFWENRVFHKEVLYVDKVPVAFIKVYTTYTKKDTGHIVIATKKSYRKNGYGKMLVQKFAKARKPAEVKYLEWGYDNWNRESARLGKSVGFHQMNKVEGGHSGTETVKDIKKSLTEATYIEATRDDGRYFPVFVFLCYTGSTIAKLIKAFTHDPYAHSSLSFDTTLNDMISFARDGMVTEDIKKGEYGEKAAQIRYSLYMYMANAMEYDSMKAFVNGLMEKKDKLKYNLLGLTNFIFGRGSEHEDRFFCSEFIASVINAGNSKVIKHQPYFTKPYSFAKNKNFIFIKTGLLKQYDPKVVDRLVAEKLEEGGFTDVILK